MMRSDLSDYIPPKRTDAIVRQVDQEWLVLDSESNKAHCLNQTAARIWQLCDGNTSVAEMAARLQGSTETPVDETVVWLALKQLRNGGLLPKEIIFPKEARMVSRREAVRKIGIAAAVALPLVTTIVMPTPAQAATCLPNGRPCISNAQCCSGKCGTGGHCNA